MAQFSVPPPIKGLSDDMSFSDQPTETSRDMQNVRITDPKTGRTRISQRPGLSKYHDGDIGSYVKDVCQVIFDSRNVTYSEPENTAIERVWSTVSPRREDALHVAVDRQSNSYFIDRGATVVKYNPAGAKILEIPLPVQKTKHRIRALFVDSFDGIYVGVSTTGSTDAAADQATAKIWKYALDENQGAVQVFEITPGAYTEELKVVNDKLYALQNLDDTVSARVTVYAGIDTEAPFVVQQFSVPYPARSFDVRIDGAVAVGVDESGDGGSREPNPKSPDTTSTATDWTPFDLTDFSERVWSWYDASEIPENTLGLTDGDNVNIMLDKSGKGRHFYGSIGTLQVPPTFNEEGIAGLPTLRFSGRDAEYMRTQENPDVDKQYRDQQRSAIPMYEGSMWALFMVVRIAKRDSGAPGLLLSQPNDNTTGGPTDHNIWVNRNCKSDPIGTLTEGSISHDARTASGSGIGQCGGGVRRPIHGSFDNTSQAVLLTILWDGGQNPGDLTATATRALFRINGEPLDRYEGIETYGLSETFLGGDEETGESPATKRGFIGDFCEMLAIDRMDPTNASPDETEVITHDEYEKNVTSTPQDQSDNELTQIEGYLAYKWGISHLLQDDTADFPHPYGWTDSGASISGPPPGGNTGAVGLTLDSTPMSIKYDAQGNPLWVYQSGANGGAGYGVRWNSDGDLYSLGIESSFEVSPQGVRLRKIVDEGNTFSTASGDGAWSVGTGDAIYPGAGYEAPRMAVDQFDNVYVPDFKTSGLDTSVQCFKSAGSSGSGVLEFYFVLPSTQQAHAVALDPNVPDYGDDNVDRAEFVFVASANGGDATTTTLHRVKLVDSVLGTGSPRTTKDLAISRGGLIRTFTTAGYATPSGSPTTTSGAQYVTCVPFREKIYIADGTLYRIYDPRTDSVSSWVASGAGEIPRRQKLLTTWQNRAVLARGADSPQNWHMSAIDDPLDWDQFPAVPNSSQAISGNNAEAGEVPDIINSMVPFNDDMLGFGGDHTLWLLTGNPNAGGSIDKVSNITGMAFGRPWCEDPLGRIYFMGSRGGLFRWTPPNHVERLTEHSIERRLQDIDFENYFIRMAWDYRQEGLVIAQCPFTSAGTLVKGWFWDTKHMAPLEDSYAITLVQPTSLFVRDSDDVDDRRLIFGCADGYIRVVDETASDDDGYRIDSYVTYGPFFGSAEMHEQAYSNLVAVLADDQDGAHFEMHATDTPDDTLGPDTLFAYGDLNGGRNPTKFERATGAFFWLRIRNAALGQRFSIESLSLEVERAGMKRVSI